MLFLFMMFTSVFTQNTSTILPSLIPLVFNEAPGLPQSTKPVKLTSSSPSLYESAIFKNLSTNSLLNFTPLISTNNVSSEQTSPLPTQLTSTTSRSTERPVINIVSNWTAFTEDCASQCSCDKAWGISSSFTKKRECYPPVPGNCAPDNLGTATVILVPCEQCAKCSGSVTTGPLLFVIAVAVMFSLNNKTF